MVTELQSYENNGITFYVSQDGAECGVSKKGLAKLAGVNDQELGRLVKRIVSSVPAFENKTPERLIPCQGMAVTRAQTSTHFVDMIPSQLTQIFLEDPDSDRQSPLVKLGFFQTYPDSPRNYSS